MHARCLRRSDVATAMTEQDLVEQIYDRLRLIVDPCSAATTTPMNLVEMGLVRDVRISADMSQVDVDLRLTSPQCLMIAYMTKNARRLIADLPGVTTVEVHADNGLDWLPSYIEPEAQERRRRSLSLLAERHRTAASDVAAPGT